MSDPPYYQHSSPVYPSSPTPKQPGALYYLQLPHPAHRIGMWPTTPTTHSPPPPPPALPAQNEMGHIKITTLNIKGANSPSTHDKWKKTISSISQKKIALLCTVESHTDDQQINSLNHTYNPKFSFIHTYNLDKPKTKGITIITNTHITKCSPSDIYHIIPSCAIQFSISWPPKAHTRILVIYAPNPPSKNRDFWNKLTDCYSVLNACKPHILLGNFNLVKDAADCLPSHPDSPQATTTLQNLRTMLDLSDSWRLANPPPKHKYSFTQPGAGSRSRIDHIYATEDIRTRASDWSIGNPEIPTDHQLVLVRIYDENPPQIRPCIPSS